MANDDYNLIVIGAGAKMQKLVRLKQPQIHIVEFFAKGEL